jgi:DnaJ-domain-containing protein 1
MKAKKNAARHISCTQHRPSEPQLPDVTVPSDKLFDPANRFVASSPVLSFPDPVWRAIHRASSGAGGPPLPEPSFSPFERLLIEQRNHPGLAVLLVIAWIASSDGTLDEAEAGFLRDVAATSGHASSVPALLQIVAGRDRNALQLACEVISRHLSGAGGARILRLAVEMAVADGALRPAENHLLRLLADVVGAGRTGLRDVFRELAGQSIPDPTDPSRAAFWGTDDAKGSEWSSSDSGATGGRDRPPRPQEWAFATLGVNYGASREEIKTAYRCLAVQHHPDRFARDGDAAIASATETFRRIKAAYEELVSHA